MELTQIGPIRLEENTKYIYKGHSEQKSFSLMNGPGMATVSHEPPNAVKGRDC